MREIISKGTKPRNQESTSTNTFDQHSVSRKSIFYASISRHKKDAAGTIRKIKIGRAFASNRKKTTAALAFERKLKASAQRRKNQSSREVREQSHKAQDEDRNNQRQAVK
jgi:hypothetical protein